MLDAYQSSHVLNWDHPPWPYMSILLAAIALMVLWRVVLYYTHRSLQNCTFQSRYPLSTSEKFLYHSVFAFQAFQTKYLHRPAILRIAGVNLFGALNFAEVLFTLLLYLANILLIILPIVKGTIPSTKGTLTEKLCLLTARSLIIHLPFLFATAGRCNLLSLLIGVSYRSLNFAHRAIGRMCITAAIIHCICAFQYIHALGLDSIAFVFSQPFTRHSIIALLCMLISGTMSVSWIRMQKFELFLVTHVIAAAIVLPMAYYHKAAAVKWLIASAVIWSVDRFKRWMGLALNHLVAPLILSSSDHVKPGTITASIEYLDGALVLRIPMHFTWTPGQHIYVSFWSKKMFSKPWLFGRWHPFTLINLPMEPCSKSQSETNISSSSQGWMGCCVVQVRNGTTKWLNQNAGPRIQVLVDGPYGGNDLWNAAHSTLVLFAGGAGITYILGVLEGLAVSARRKHAGNLRRVEIYWILKNEAQLSWVEPRISEMCSALENYNLVVSAHAYSTKRTGAMGKMHIKTRNRPVPIALQLTPMCISDYVKIVRDARLDSPPAQNSAVSLITRKSVFTMVTGRPNLDQLCSEICERSQGTIFIHVCAPRGLSEAVKISAAQVCSPLQTWKGKLNKCFIIHHELFNTM